MVGRLEELKEKADNSWRATMEGERESCLLTQVQVKDFVFFLSKMEALGRFFKGRVT